MTPSPEEVDEVELTLGYYLLVFRIPVVSRRGLREGVEQLLEYFVTERGKTPDARI